MENVLNFLIHAIFRPRFTGVSSLPIDYFFCNFTLSWSTGSSVAGRREARRSNALALLPALLSDRQNERNQNQTRDAADEDEKSQECECNGYVTPYCECDGDSGDRLGKLCQQHLPAASEADEAKCRCI